MRELIENGIRKISEVVPISLAAAAVIGILPPNNAHAGELMAGKVIKVTNIQMTKDQQGNWFNINNVLPAAIAAAGGALGAGVSKNGTVNVAAAALGGAAGMVAGAALSGALNKVDGVRVIFRTDDGGIHYIDMTREQYEDYKLSCFKGSDVLVSVGYQNDKLIDCSAPMNFEYQSSSRSEGNFFVETSYNPPRRKR